jgi:hypothetical protein
MAISIPNAVQETIITDKWYVTTIIIELDGKFIKVVCNIGTGDGADFVQTRSPVTIEFKNIPAVLDSEGNIITPAKNNFDELMGTLYVIKDAENKTTYDLLFGTLVEKCLETGAIKA